MVTRAWIGLLLAATLLNDRPPLIWVDDDRKTIPEPADREISPNYDFVTGNFGRPVYQVIDIPKHIRSALKKSREAQNVNAVDEVPNSSWYTNRNFLHPMILEESRRGPEKVPGPSLGGSWTVVACKNDGVTPGLRIKDSNGDVYLLKFDPPTYPELMSAADVIGSKVFYAAGYNVPANYIVVFPLTQLEIPADLKCSLAGMVENDGKVRALASKFLDGKPKGPFSYTGWREDDPNDVIPHEHRRELRGLRVIASFINHNDLKQVNTLDMYVEEDGRRFLKHHLIDFGAALGSASVAPKTGQEGHEYIFDAMEVLKSALGLGLYRRRSHPGGDIVHPAIGHIEGEKFDPALWKPNLPIAPFQRMTDRDAYWGAKIVAAFTDDQIRELIKTGQYSSPEAAEKLFQILRLRRDKIANHWFRKSVAPIDRFRFEGDRLVFDDLAVNGGYDCNTCPEYRYEEETSRIKITRTSPGWPTQSVTVYIGTVNRVHKVLGVER